MRVNLGCGDRYAPGWVNVDHAGSPHRKDLVVDLAGPLPWGSETIDYAYAGHLLEHLTTTQCLELLRNMRECMTPNGELMIVGPDVLRAKIMADSGTLDVTLDSLIHGAHRWDGDEHRWECDPATVCQLLEAADWRRTVEMPISFVPELWPVADRGPQWQFAIMAQR